MDAADRGRPTGVEAVFAPTERRCPSCGARAVTAGRWCPDCGASYVARRAKPLRSRRSRLIFAGVLAAVLGGIGIIAALLAPGIDSAKRAHAAAARQADAAAQAATLVQERSSQRLRLAGGRARDPGVRAPRASRIAARTALVHELERAITADARARARTGAILFTTCSPYPAGTTGAQRILSTPAGSYSCLAVNSSVKSSHGAVGQFGDPFWARIEFATSRLAWCKITPRPGEQAVGAGTAAVPLAPACDLSRSAPLPLR